MDKCRSRIGVVRRGSERAKDFIGESEKVRCGFFDAFTYSNGETSSSLFSLARFDRATRVHSPSSVHHRSIHFHRRSPPHVKLSQGQVRGRVADAAVPRAVPHSQEEGHRVCWIGRVRQASTHFWHLRLCRLRYPPLQSRD